MSPEQVEGKEADLRSDIISLTRFFMRCDRRETLGESGQLPYARMPSEAAVRSPVVQRDSRQLSWQHSCDVGATIKPSWKVDHLLNESTPIHFPSSS
jgi:hypothetical protein